MKDIQDPFQAKNIYKRLDDWSFSHLKTRKDINMISGILAL